MKELTLIVPPEKEKARLDIFLAEYSAENGVGLSRTAIQSLIRNGNVFLNSAPINKTDQKIVSGDEIKVIIPEKEKEQILAEKDIPLEIVYEDNDILVINKQSGLVVHPGAGNKEHTLVNALLGKGVALSDINKNRPGIVHRLDKETSGLLVIAKNNSSHLKLTKQFAQHSIKRKYAAIVLGRMEFDEDVIEAPIGRHPLKRKSMAVSFAADNKYAKTFYRTIKRSKNFSFLELEPFTGRTHQLRVHLAHLGFPILGDTKYGKSSSFFNRLALHAFELGFIHPATNKPVFFKTKIPPEFEDFIKKNIP